MKTQARRKIVIIGGGFGGLNVAKGLKGLDADITLLDKSNHHLFQPLLYQVATTQLSPGDIAVPLRSILKKNRNVRVVMAEVQSVNKTESYVQTVAGEKYFFDELVIAVGSKHSYFGRDEWESYATGLKTLSDALRIREKILYAFERAEIISDESLRRRYLTFVVVGGGPTGVEMAGAIAEISKQTLKNDFRRIDPSQARIVIVEGSPRVLNRYPDELCQKAKESLEDLGVEIMVNSVVSDISAKGVLVGECWIESETVVWAAGNTAPAFLQTLDVPLDKTGQVIVNGDLTIPGFSNIFVIGDASKSVDRNNNPLPGIAPVAIQEGKYVSKILRKKEWKRGRPVFVYFDKGTLATIGRASAVATIFSIKFSGFLAWLFWSAIHIMFLINFRTKVMVMLSWFWSYLNSYRGVRLITRLTNNAPLLGPKPEDH